MEIDRAYVQASLDNLHLQETEEFEKLSKVRGAILLAERLLARLDESPPAAPESVTK